MRVGNEGGGNGEGGNREEKEVAIGRQGVGKGRQEAARGGGISQMDMMECLGGHKLYMAD